jgi:hypothetical protein
MELCIRLLTFVTVWGRFESYRDCLQAQAILGATTSQWQKTTLDGRQRCCLEESVPALEQLKIGDGLLSCAVAESASDGPRSAEVDD